MTLREIHKKIEGGGLSLVNWMVEEMCLVIVGMREMRVVLGVSEEGFVRMRVVPVVSGAGFLMMGLEMVVMVKVHEGGE